MHHLEANETHGEKGQELLKNTKSFFEQILEAAPHKTATVYAHLPSSQKTIQDKENKK